MAARISIPHPHLFYPMNVERAAHNHVPAQGTLPRCQHGSYISKGETRALYCWLCTPGGPLETREVVLPRSSAHPLDDSGHVYANKRAVGCPECGSRLYMRVIETEKDLRECAECGHKYEYRNSYR